MEYVIHSPSSATLIRPCLQGKEPRRGLRAKEVCSKPNGDVIWGKTVTASHLTGWDGL